jgi:hypothetical protein
MEPAGLLRLIEMDVITVGLERECSVDRRGSSRGFELSLGGKWLIEEGKRVVVGGFMVLMMESKLCSLIRVRVFMLKVLDLNLFLNLDYLIDLRTILILFYC